MVVLPNVLLQDKHLGQSHNEQVFKPCSLLVFISQRDNGTYQIRTVQQLLARLDSSSPLQWITKLSLSFETKIESLKSYYSSMPIMSIWLSNSK